MIRHNDLFQIFTYISFVKIERTFSYHTIRSVPTCRHSWIQDGFEHIFRCHTMSQYETLRPSEGFNLHINDGLKNAVQPLGILTDSFLGLHGVHTLRILEMWIHIAIYISWTATRQCNPTPDGIPIQKELCLSKRLCNKTCILSYNIERCTINQSSLEVYACKWQLAWMLGVVDMGFLVISRFY